MSDNIRSCASCAEDLITFEAEHRESDQPSENVEMANNGTIGRTSSESGHKRFSRFRRPATVRSPEEKEQRNSYTQEKKRATKRVKAYIKNNDFDKMSGWLKFRCAVFHKLWIKFYCVLKPGLLVVYKNENMQRRVGWVGTILLSSVYIIERPTQREGFCFKLIHCLNKSLWVNKGPKKLQPVGNLKGLNLPLTSVIIRAESEQVGKQWLQGMKSMCASFFYDVIPSQEEREGGGDINDVDIVPSSPSISSADDERQQNNNMSHESVEIDQSNFSQIHEETMYIRDDEEPLSHLDLNFKTAGNQLGSGKLDILLGLARQIKPNQPLSRIVIPPFVNYPRSFLDKLQDMFYRVDLIADMCNAPTPRERMELFAKFMLWLQNFHPTREMKKYYNSVLGERSRCYFQHPNGSRTHFVAEEVTHHPPASAIYCVNKQEGFHIKVLMEFEIRFHGYYVRTNVRGRLEVTLEKLGEVYKASFPDLLVLNIFIGQFRIDFEGPCTLSCDQTGYTCQIENKTRWSPWGRENQFHRIRARLYDEKQEELLQAEGHWNGAVYTKTAGSQQKEREKLFWKVDKSTILQKYVVHQSDWHEYESNRLWAGLTEALRNGDEEMAIEQKTIVEQYQRELRANREQMNVEYKPNLMTRDESDENPTKIFNYIHHSDRPWDPSCDEYQYEHNFVIKTHKRGTLPSIASASRVEDVVDDTSDGTGSMRGVIVMKQPSRERVDRYNFISEGLHKEQRFESSMQAQMVSIQKELQTLHEELRTLKPDKRAGKTETPVKNSRSNGGISWTSVLFCLFVVILCVFYTYFRELSST